MVLVLMAAIGLGLPWSAMGAEKSRSPAQGQAPGKGHKTFTAPQVQSTDKKTTTTQEAEPMRVGEIKFEGLVAHKPEDLLPRLATKAKEPYNPIVLREDVTRLGELMRQVAVRVENMPENKIRVIFTVEEFPRLRKMQVLGNSKLTTERIEKIAKLKSGDALEERVIKSLRNALMEEYKKLGLAQAKIDIKTAPVEPETAPAPPEAKPAEAKPQPALADLQIIIQEGEQILVNQVELEGNKIFSTARLKFHLQTKGSWWFVKNYYDDKAFEDDLDALRNFYASNGYFDASIERGAFRDEMKKGKHVITPVITIREGEQYTLNSVDVRGARLFSREEVLAPFENLSGTEFKGKTFAHALNELRNLYFDAGFLTTEIKPVNEFDHENHAVNVTIQITEKDRIYVGKVKIQRPKEMEEETVGFFRKLYGRFAPPISDEAIMREVLLKPGETFSKRKERETIRRLDRLGVFNNPEGKPTIKIINEPTANPRVNDAVIELQEGNTGDFGGGIGYGDVSGVFGFVWLTERNLFGEARDLRVQLQIGMRASSASISYLDRHYNGTDDALRASVYYSLIRPTGYTQNNIGTTVEMSHPLYDDWERTVRARIEFVRLNPDSGITTKEDLNASYPVLTGRLGFRQDTRYPYQYPKEGRLLEGGLEAGYGGGPLVKLTGNAEFYRQLPYGLVFRSNPSFGLIPYDASTVGLTERLFLGGADDLRGFKFRGAGLRDPLDSEVGVGGAVKLLVRNEVLVPIYEPLSGVFFVDSGLLGANPFNYEGPRMSTGVGLRMSIRQATVAVDFAVPILRQSGDQTQFVHFSFKSSF